METLELDKGKILALQQHKKQLRVQKHKKEKSKKALNYLKKKYNGYGISIEKQESDIKEIQKEIETLKKKIKIKEARIENLKKEKLIHFKKVERAKRDVEHCDKCLELDQLAITDIILEGIE
jgi:multidrug resistance efflux pump